jgi:hypothetical protein
MPRRRPRRAATPDGDHAAERLHQFEQARGIDDGPEAPEEPEHRASSTNDPSTDAPPEGERR